jgi:hypothetical protein
MKRNSRKLLRTKLAQAISEDIKSLSPELKEVLVDDIITAFENRLIVLNVQPKLECVVNLGVEVMQ